MVCERCGTQNPEKAAFCRKCGSQLTAKTKAPANYVEKAPVNTQTKRPRKRRMTHTTRKTSAAYVIPQLLGDFILAGFAGFALVQGAELYDSYWYRSEGKSLQTLGYIFFFVAMLSALYHVMVSKTYVDFFEDRVSGSGMQGIQSKSFNLHFDQISGISTSKGFLNFEAAGGTFLVINTLAGNYKIITTEARANEIIEYYSTAANR